MKQLDFALLFMVTTSLVAQEINQLENKGERHGFWKKSFDNTNQPR
jgi:hypothetical protein